MKDRMAGKVNAYGRTLTDAEKGGRDDGGIMVLVGKSSSSHRRR